MKMTATGDSILIQGYPEGGYPGFEEVKAYIGKGEARFGNLETCITDWDTYASAYSGGTWMNAEPRILPQILGYGFNFLGFANNHTMDLGPDGLLETVENVKKTGTAIAGAGKNLAEASAPVFRDFAGGRVGFISVTASIADAGRAGNQSRTMKGRPGANMLRKSKRVMINAEHFQALKEIVANTAVNGSREMSIRDGFTPADPEGEIPFENYRFCLTDGKEEVVTAPNKTDLKRILAAVEDAKLVADYVVVMLHDHAMKGRDAGEPDDACHSFCRTLIDNGVDAVIGTGTHQFKPIEIYKGHPIFYSLGNFCFQSNMVEHQPADMFDKYGLSMDMNDIRGLAARSSDWKIGHHTQFFNFRTVIPYMEFEGHTMTKLQLMPVELGFDKVRSAKGIPYPANEQQTKEIFDRVNELSAPYGTKLTLNAEGLIDVEV